MAIPVEFEWDDDKAAANESKHGVAFDFARRVFLDPEHIEFDASRAAEGEERRKVVGFIDGKLHVAVVTFRGHVCRIISARRANSSEEKRYGDRSHEA